MLNLHSLKKNCIVANQIGYKFIDKLKYLLLLYSNNKIIRNFIGAKVFKIRFQFEEPLGIIIMQIRNNRGSDSFVFSEVFQHQYYKIEEKYAIKKNVIIMDLGANAGFTAVYFSRLYHNAKIICVEPIPENVNLLKKNIEINKVNAIILESAICISDGVIEMELSENDYGHKVHNIEFGRNFNNGQLSVNAVSINTILQNLRISNIHILKIDIEGYEGVLFESNNLWLEKVDKIIMEVHENVSVKRIIDIVRPFNFVNISNEKGNWVFEKP